MEPWNPYDDLNVVTKVGARRGPAGEWVQTLDLDDLRAQVHDNLEHLDVLDVLDVVNLRAGADHGANDESIAAPFEVLAELRQQGLIRHLGLSAVSTAQLTEAQAIALIPGTSSVAHLRENMAAADLVLPADARAELDGIG